MLDMETNWETSNEMIARFRINWEDGQEITQAHIMSNRAICFGINDRRLFIFVCRVLIACVYVLHLLYLCTERYLGRSCVLARVSSAALIQTHSP